MEQRDVRGSPTLLCAHKVVSGVSAQGARRGLMTLTAQVKWHCLPPSPAIALYLPTLVHLLSSYHFLMFTFTWEFVQCPLL